MVAALAPALQSRGFDVAHTLKAGSRGEGRTRGPLRTSLLVVQAALSIVLLVGAALFVQSLERVTALRLGFARDSVAYLRLPLTQIDQVDGATVLPQLAPRLEQITGVEGVALASFAPMMGASSTGVWVSRPEGMVLATPYPRSNAVAPSFFDVAGIRILQGRGFVEGETTGVLIADETMASTLWPGEDPIGQCVVIGRTADGPCLSVVGVAEDQRDSQVLEDAMPRYFLPLSEASLLRTIVMRVDPRAWPDASASVREIAASYLDAQTFDLNRVTDRLEPQYRTWRLGARLFGVFGLLALLVTVVGVYGVMAYVASERTHEMGVRIALGARLADLLRLVIGDGLRVVVLGCLVGIALAMAMGRLVASLLYEVTPRDPTAMIGATAVLLVAGAAASLVPALRAARVDPNEVLRQD
jgi:predicted permease